MRLEPDRDALEGEFLAGERTYPALFRLLEEQYARRLGKPRWGDKSLNTERYADEIFAAYPGARILHMIRDPRDRFASSFTRWKRRRGGVGAGTAEWLSSARLARRNERLYPAQARTVRYETLVSDPEGTVREICAFIDEPFAPEMLSMQGAERFREEGSNSSYGPRDPGVISTGSIGRYREVLSRRQVAFIERFARQEMALFGYEPEVGALPSRQRLAFELRDVPIELGHLFAWRTREAVRDRAGRPVPSYRLVPAGQAT
jgi:hypothetical protein